MKKRAPGLPRFALTLARETLLPYRRGLAFVLLCYLLLALAGTLAPWPLKVLVDNVVGDRPLFGFDLRQLPLGWLLAGIAAAHWIFSSARGWLGAVSHEALSRIGDRAAQSLSRDLFARLLARPLAYHDQARVGELVSRVIDDAERLKECFFELFSLLFRELLLLAAIVVIMLRSDPALTLLSLLSVTPLFLVFATLPRWIGAEAAEARKRELGRFAHLTEALSNIKAVRIFRRELWERRRFLARARAKRERNEELARLQGHFSFLIEAVSSLSYGVVLGYSGYRVAQGKLSLGQMVIFLQYLSSLHAPIRRFSGLGSLFEKGVASLGQIRGALDGAPESRPAFATALKPVAGAPFLLELENVAVGHEAKVILANVSLRVREGERIALLGPTGSGKTSLLNVIAGLYPPRAGSLRLRGAELSGLHPKFVRAEIAYVLQDAQLFAGTIADNILLGRRVPAERLRTVAELSQVARFTDPLPAGLATEIGERGLRLSGGERQRVALARALLLEAPLLLFDEPTSALDEETEQRILEALANQLKGRTVIFATHRPSMLRLATRVLRVDGASRRLVEDR